MHIERGEIVNIYTYLKNTRHNCIAIPVSSLEDSWSVLKLDAYATNFLLFHDSNCGGFHFFVRRVDA